MIPISDFTPENKRYKALLERSSEFPGEILSTVESILKNVKEKGDIALFSYMEQFDNISLSPNTVRVTEAEFSGCIDSVSAEFREAVKVACENIACYHEKQIQQSYSYDDGDGVVLSRRVRPIQKVGVCVPAGLAPLCSSFIMSVVPAKIAGVPEIFVITAPRDGKVDPHILYTAQHLNVQDVFKISGAQGVAALAYGTDSIPAVDKIVGPSNVYGTTAKRLVYGHVGIDSLAGPSEIVVIADDTANPAYAAADLISQAEHGTGMEAAVALVTDRRLAEKIAEKIGEFVRKYGLKDAVEEAFKNYGNIFLVRSLDEAIAITNILAPEHVEIMAENGKALAEKVINAGAIFIGDASPEPVGDYICGTNHILPTCGTARFSSALGVSDFLKSTSIVSYTGQRLKKTAPLICTLAQAEGMRGHALSVLIRLNENPELE